MAIKKSENIVEEIVIIVESLALLNPLKPSRIVNQKFINLMLPGQYKFYDEDTVSIFPQNVLPLKQQFPVD